jgi:hypothetical protein
MPQLTAIDRSGLMFLRGAKNRPWLRWTADPQVGVDDSSERLKAPATMKHFSSKIVASLLVVAVTASAALASANPQCGDDKKDDKSGETKPKAPSAR